MYKKHSVWYILDHKQDWDGMLFVILPGQFFSLTLDTVKYKLDAFILNDIVIICFIYVNILYIYNKLLNKQFSYIPTAIVSFGMFKFLLGIHVLYVLIIWYSLCILLLSLLKFFNNEVEI